MKKLLLLLLIVSLLLPMTSIQAQGIEGDDLVLPDGRVIILPTGWIFEESESLYVFSNATSTNMIIMVSPDLLQEAMNYGPKTDLADLLMDVYHMAYEVDLDATTFDTLQTEDERTIVMGAIDTEGTSDGSAALIIEVEPGLYAYVELHAFDDADDLQTMLDIVVTLRPEGTEAVGLADEDTTTTAATGEPCTVETDETNVALRVGPGENRGVFTAMPVATALPVLGQAEANDGSLWWRVDLESGANELWVADTDVVTSGDCALVQDVNAPPVIPGGSGASNTDNTGTTNPQPPATNPPAAGMVECPIQNLSVFTLKGDLYGPNGEYYHFEVGAGATITLNVPAGTYSVHYYCDGCGNAGGDAVWNVNGRTIFQIQVTDQPY